MPAAQPHVTPFAESADGLAASFAASYSGVVAFITVVTAGSFVKAGDRLGVGRSAVSRSVQKLEQQIGFRLFFRTTRHTSLTREGELFYESCRPGVERIVRALDGMRELREGPPRGRLRVTSTVSFGRRVVGPLLSGFQAQFPEVEVDLQLDDGTPDFTSAHIDIAFRHGRLPESQIIAKQLAPMQLVLCASPAYASEHGLPKQVEELGVHRCVNYRLASGRVEEWEFEVDGQLRKFMPKGKSSFNDADLVLRAVLDGQGLAQLAGYQVAELLRNGQLLSCLAHGAPTGRGHYLCYLSRQHQPSRVRAFIDYMSQHIRTSLDSLSTHNIHDGSP